MGAIFNAQANHSPLVITAGQQARSLVTVQANLTNRDATRMPHPLVKWSYEPARPEDVPLALGRAAHLAKLPPTRPDVRLDPDGRLGRRGRRRLRPRRDRPPHHRPRRRRAGDGGGPRPTAGGGEQPGAGRGPGRRRERRLGGGGDPRRAPAAARVRDPGARRRAARLPRGPPATSAACCRPAIGPVAETLAGHDLILVVGSSVFPYYPNIPGPLLPEGAELVAITSDPDEAARAPMGEAIVADVRLTLERLLEEVGESDRDPGESLPEPTAGPGAGPDHRHGGDERARRRLPGGRDRRPRGPVLDPGAAQPAPPLATRAATTSAPAAGSASGSRRRSACSSPSRERPVVCVVGEGSVQYAVTAFWSAVAYQAPVTFLVLRNSEYAILKWFARHRGRQRRAGARPAGARHRGDRESAYGVAARKVEGAEALREALGEAIGSGRPELVEVGVAPGMWLF